MYSNITSSLRFLPMDLSGSFDGENSWENRSKKKNAVTWATGVDNSNKGCFGRRTNLFRESGDLAGNRET